MHGKRMVIVGVVLAIGLTANGIAQGQEPVKANTTAKTETKQTTQSKTESKKSPPGTGWLSFITNYSTVKGDGQNFRQDQRLDDSFMYGLRDLGYRLKTYEGTLELRGRAVMPDDYGMNLRLEKRGLGWIKAYFDMFPSYWDTSNFYYDGAPYIYKLDRDVTQRRRKVGAEVGYKLWFGPTLVFRMKHWEMDGSRSTFWGGTVSAPGTRYYYPQVNHVDQERTTLGLELRGSAGRFKIKTGVEVEDFDGRNRIPNHLFTAAGALNQIRYNDSYYNWTTLTPFIEVEGDIIENILRWELYSRYRYTYTSGTYDENAFDGSGVPTNASHAHNYVDNEHRGDVNEVLTNTRFVYTPNRRTTLFAGFGVKFEDADHHGMENSDDEPNGIADEIVHIDTNDNRRTWMMNYGGSYRILRWLKAKAEARWEYGDTTRNWRDEEVLGGTDVSRYRTNGDFDKFEYSTSLTAKPRRDLKFVARWRQKMADYDVDVKEDTSDGVPDTTYPGVIRRNNRRTNEWSVLSQYRPNKYWAASYKVIGRVTDYNTHVSEERSSGVATEQSIINSFSLTFTPFDVLSVTGSAGNQAMDVRTKAADATSGRVPNFNGDSHYWGLDVSCDVTKRIAVSTGVYQTTANSIFDYKSTDFYARLEYKLNKMWSLDYGYRYVVFDEHGNGNIDDYSAHIFTFGAKAKW